MLKKLSIVGIVVGAACAIAFFATPAQSESCSKGSLKLLCQNSPNRTCKVVPGGHEYECRKGSTVVAKWDLNHEPSSSACEEARKDIKAACY